MKNDPLKISGMHDGANRTVFRNAAKLRENMTEPEKKLWEYLRKKPLGFKFRRQHPIAGYVLDFYCHKYRLSIEIDGGYHLKKDQRLKDTKRSEYLKEVGISEIRFTNYEVLNNFDNSVNKIFKELSADTPLGDGASPFRGFRGQGKGN